ncbi:MAG: M48 family metallopeptidase [Ktedonobacteraceae bacterium]|nr:M48 family metallopeptidase [Ktedonobacteraceae bacterium]
MSMEAQKSLHYGGSTIHYTVHFARRKTASIEVHPDSHVTVIVPEGSEPTAIETLIHTRAHWILRQQQQFTTYAPQETPRAYVSGESYRYLGRQYRLKVLEGEQEGVKLGRGFLSVTVADKTRTHSVQHLVGQWYRETARHLFSQRLAICYPRIGRLGVACPSLLIRSMKTRWGSCSHSGLIILNPRLVQTPIDCIDYVVLHELCHLKEHNHSKQYYHLLDHLLPDWRERRQKLNMFELC